MSWTYFGSMVPVQLELNVPHICFENDRFHLNGRGGGGRSRSRECGTCRKDSPHRIVMSQKQKSEGKIKRFILTKEVAGNVVGPSQAEILLRVTSGIAAELIKAHDSGLSVSLNEVRAKISKKHGFGGVPRLVDIISAIPDDYKKALLPKLRARPIRTASGVCFVPAFSGSPSHRRHP